MNDEIERLLTIAEDAIVIDADERERVRAATMQTYAREREHPSGAAGDTEIIRLDETTDDRHHPRRRSLLLVAAAVLAVVAGLELVGRDDRGTTPAAVAPTTAPRPPATVPSERIPSPPATLAPGIYRGTELGLPVAFETTRELEVVAVADGAVVLELPGDPEAGEIVVAIDAEFVDAVGLEDWVADRDATTQESIIMITEVLGGNVPVVDILGSPDGGGCPETACPLFESADGRLRFETQVGTLSQIVVASVNDRPLVIAARDQTPDLELHAEAFRITSSLVMLGDDRS